MTTNGAKTILLVDDEALIALDEAEILKQYGYHVIMVYSGEDAVQAVQTMPEIDMILMDIELGRGMDGAQAAEAILAQRDLPIIFLSSHTERDVVEKTGGIPSYGYIVKNTAETVLVASIKMAFQLFDTKVHEQGNEETLRGRESRYRALFDEAPFAVMEEDFSETNAFLHQLRQQGVSDFRAYFDQNPESVLYSMSLMKVVSVNQAALVLYDAIDFDHLVRNLSGTVTEESFELLENALVFLAEESQFFEGETTQRTLSGEIRHVYIRAFLPRGRKKPFSSVILAMMDITKRKQAEAVMAARSRLLRLANTCSLEELLQATVDEAELLTNSLVGFYHFVEPDQKTLHLQVWSTHTQEEMCRAEGAGLHYPVNDAGVWTDCIHARRPVIHKDYLSLPHRKGFPVGHATIIRELVIPVMRGEQIVAVLGVGNKPVDYCEEDIETVTSLADLAWDIAERKRIEDELSESEQRHRTILQTAMDGFLLVDMQGRLLEVNLTYCEMSGYSEAELLSMSIIDLDADEEPLDTAAHIHKVLARGQDRFVSRHRRKDGSTFPVEISVQYKPGDEDALVVFLRDITEQKQAEDLLRKSAEQYRRLVEELQIAIQEKQGLLRELQHRAKNSFLLITSMIELVANNSQVGEVQTALSEIHSRVKALSELYSLLYSTDSVTETRLDTYCSLIASSLEPFSGSIPILTDFEPVYVPVKTAAPLGLILTELITNAMKYAFPGDASGTITLLLKKEGTKAVIEVIDDGVGFPAELDFAASHSLGLTLVQALTGQIQGHFEMARDNGTRCRVEFPLEEF